VPSLPGVNEEFSADAGPYLTAIQAMIDETRNLIDAVTELHAAIDDLPDTKTIEINVGGDAVDVITAIKEDLDALDDRTVVVNIVYRDTGGGEDIAHGTIDETIDLTTAGSNNDAIKDMNDSLDQLIGTAEGAGDEMNVLRERFVELAAQVGVTADEAIADFDEQLDDLRAQGADTEQVINSLRGTIGELSEGMAGFQAGAEDMSAGLIEVTAAEKALAEEIDNTSLSYTRQQAIINASANANKVLAQTDVVLAAANEMLGETAEAQKILGEEMESFVQPTRNWGKSISDSTADLSYFREVIEGGGGSVKDFDEDVNSGIGTMLAFTIAAKRMGDNVGGITIPITALTFGITGIGTAIHLVVMGIFEFAAVFIPAMIAAGAAASVLNQGFMDVYDGLKGVEVAGESLGPMFGKTQGDMIGLGHSLQIAQNAADPDAYEILGEAIIGVNDATGHLNDQLGEVTHTSGTASGGISSFGQMGIAVGGILEKFAADIDIDLSTGMTQFTGLISKGAQDLVEFGQILGNIGHAILNLASAMPGLAEIVLGIIDAFSDFIKIISELPPMLITVVMGIEEAYRWSGLLVGVFGLLGRAIALVGTLGIPVFAKIGLNMGAMVASVLTGVGGMVTNLMALFERVTAGGEAMARSLGAVTIADEAALMSGAVDEAATGMVAGLGKAAAFMSGPWGAAIMLAVAGLAVMTIWLLHAKSATEEWIDAQEQAIETAANLTVLNSIGSTMAATTAKITAQTTILTNATRENAAEERAQQITMQGLGGAANSAGGNINALTAYQQTLYQQSTNVISGAEQISKAYGVSFTAALGLADMANVKLVNGISGNSKAAEEARIQIQGLVQGYAAMNQSGTTLSNSMEAVSVQAQMQGTKVSALNSAWDSFMSMATSLTGSFSQINLDMQQMGNIAPAVGSKITAFTGATTMSVSQIAESLKTFSGTSAQVWQAYNQSLSSAETFTDNIRTASAAGVVTQQQYGAAISGVVNMLLPYAKDSAAARDELSVLAQEAGYAGGTSFADLKSWVDKTGGSTVNLGALVDNLTGKLSNVTAVAKNFAGTLQSDVLSAIANAAVGTSSITGLTQKYTESLQANGTQAPQTKSAQDALTTAMEHLGFTQTEAQQTTEELSTAYAGNTSAANKNTTSIQGVDYNTKTLAGTLTGPGLLAVDVLKSHTDQLTQQYTGGLIPAMDQTGGKASTTANGPMKDLQQMTQSIHGWTQQLETVMKQWPANEHTNVNVTGTGGANIKSNIPGVPSGVIQILQGNLGLAAGGVLPGYAPGHDVVPAMLSPGEGILTPDAVRAIGGATTVHKLNAQHFAGGGIALPNVSGTATNILGTATSDITAGFKSAMTSALEHYQDQYNTYAKSAAGNVSGTVAGWLTEALKADGAPMSWLPALAWLTNAESSGNPNAVDPIPVMGEHAEGLLQTLPSTFWAYMNPSVPGGIFNPVANAAAAIRYIESMYGSPLKIPGMFVHDAGYDEGGWLMPGLTLAHNNTGQPEKIIGPNGGDDGVNHVHVYLDGKKIWDNMQKRTLQYDSRNNGNGNVTGSWAPNRNR
jgi:SLT domain-containing protein